jgi:GPH family glycoside/pentoside/hexuronide:cation symporter
MWGLRFFYSFLPIVGVVGAILVMWNYDITEEKAAEIRAALQVKKSEAMATESSS